MVSASEEHPPVFVLNKNTCEWVCGNCEDKADVQFAIQKVCETHIEGLSFAFECSACDLTRPMTEKENNDYLEAIRIHRELRPQVHE